MKLEDAIGEIKNLAKEFKARNGNASLRIPNKDFNLWMINWMIKQDGRIGKIETKVTVVLLMFTVTIALLGFTRFA